MPSEHFEITEGNTNSIIPTIILGNPEMMGNGGSGNKVVTDPRMDSSSGTDGYYIKPQPPHIHDHTYEVAFPEEERGTYDITSPARREMYNGGMLTGSKILEEIEAGHIRITPFDKTKVNPNSYNLTLNNTLLVYSDKVIDFKKNNPTNKIIIPESGLVLKPNTLYIGRTNERCWTDRYIPQLDGRSSIGRLGITIHVTAGYGDIGWDGTWTLEIMAIHPVRIYPNIEFCQISYHTPYGLTNIQYEGRYQGQIDPTASRSSLDKKVYV